MNRQELYDLLDSWENIQILIQHLIDHPEQIDLLMDIALNDTRKSSWRAAWLIDKVHEKQAGLIQPYIPEMILALRSINDDAKKRHFLKLISLNRLPGQQLSFLLDFCLNEFTNANQAVAIRVHAMQVLYEISETEPEFKHELIQLIGHEIEYHNSPGISSRGRKLLKKLAVQTKI